MTIIRHKLKGIKDIAPWGNDVSGYFLHWFGLTDSYYWIAFDQTELLRYSDQFADKYGFNKDFPYVDYQFARILDDFITILNDIITPIPDSIFEFIKDKKSFDEFRESLRYWLNTVWNEDDEQYDSIYLPASEWIFSRRLDFGYLVGGPEIYIFKNNDNVYIRWDCKYEDDSGIKMWKEPSGEYIISYEKFIESIKLSFDSFFKSMDEQIDKILYGETQYNFAIDKELLVKNHNDQKRLYNSSFEYIHKISKENEVDWSSIKESIELIKSGK